MARLPGFPYKSYPRGWYQIAWTHELAAEAVRPARYFGKDFVIYRSHAGNVIVLDAHCLHMGAHLGHGGKVCGEDIVCPFHGWKWNSQGENTEIPYSKQNRISAKLRRWDVIERSGLVLMWYDPSGARPDFEPPPVPEFDDASYYPITPHGSVKGEVPFPPQLVLENAVDIPHLKCVHNWNVGEPGLTTFEDRGRSFYVESHGSIKTSRGPALMRTKIEAWGVGLIYSHLTGLRDMGFVSAMTPIDEGRSEVRLSTAVRRKDDKADGQIDAFAKAMIDAQVEEVLGMRAGGDRDIWEHMEYRTNPALVREEIPSWTALRSWASKFYADAPNVPGEAVASAIA